VLVFRGRGSRPRTPPTTICGRWRRRCSPYRSCTTTCSAISGPKGTELAVAWGYDFDPGSNIVDVYVRALRKKLGAATIDTIRGMGYRLS